MKSIISMLAVGFLISCSGDIKTAELKLESMQCMMCASVVEEAVAALDGVKKVEVDLKGNSGKVTYKASILDLAAIENVITSVGYSVNDKKADSEAYAKLEICCKMPEDH
ncbi:MAG: heavy-metal-associated domain-containing protein [Candidatus Marinimicrobia bacterium]|nr:heavy-metal-associated domain-containing protein [Candidatus Neomarinimicrobiota bacterium]MDP6611008.1 heavy-metal-associated domain-containing protein [Candidatus Neomarinimicrobiota bacterium]